MADSEQAADAVLTAEVPLTLGQTLRNARLAQELTIEQVATELRIEAKQLNALEENRLEQIGVPVFVKGYIKQYGQRLGLDVRDLLALYYRQTTLADVQIKPNRTIKLRDERQIASWVLAGVVLLTVAVGLAVWWWNGGTLDFLPATLRTTQTPAATAAAAPEPQRAAPQPTAASPTQPTAGDERPTAAAPPGAESPPPAVREAPLAGLPAPASAPDDGDRASPTITVPLVFTFAGESWTEVTDGRGERLAYGLNTAGKVLQVRGEPPFTVVLGNAGSVRLTVDGAPYPIPAPSRRDNLARFSVDLSEE